MKSLPEINRDNQQAGLMSARRLVELYGDKLLGQEVWTPACGDYPGGIATITMIAPDVNAPEIVFEVEHPIVGSMGMFDHEQVELLNPL